MKPRHMYSSVSRRTFLAGAAALSTVAAASRTAHAVQQSTTGKLDVERFVEDVKRARLETDSQKAVEEVLKRTVSDPRAGPERSRRTSRGGNPPDLLAPMT